MNCVLLCLLFGAVSQGYTEDKSQDGCDNYCQMDYDDLVATMTKNSSVEPCENFKEFAVGGFIRNATLKDGQKRIGFYPNNDLALRLKFKEVLSAEVNANDTRATIAAKKLYAKCTDFDYLEQDLLHEFRDYIGSFGLTFYPENNQNKFDLAKFVEELPKYALAKLLLCKLQRTADHLELVELHATPFDLGKYKMFLYKFFHVTRNNSEERENFNAIANEMEKFFYLEQNRVNYEFEDVGILMSIEELNNLTSKLKLDWSNIINNSLLTKLGPQEKIYVDSPKTLENLAEFIALANKKTVADYLVYDFMYANRDWLDINPKDNYWDRCIIYLNDYMGEALTYLHYLRYFDQTQQESLRGFLEEAKKFGVKVIKAKALWNKTDVDYLASRFSSMKILLGYPTGSTEQSKIEKDYADWQLSDEQTFVERFMEIQVRGDKIALEPFGSETRKYYDRTYSEHQSFVYSAADNTLFVDILYLQYPFYHYKRPRFFNSATAAHLFFEFAKDTSDEYFYEKYGHKDSEVFDEHRQVAFDFYDDWLKAGGNELPMDIRGLSYQQLYWIASARVLFEKESPLYFTSFEFSNVLDNLHKYYKDTQRFREAFHCSET